MMHILSLFALVALLNTVTAQSTFSTHIIRSSALAPAAPSAHPLTTESESNNATLHRRFPLSNCNNHPDSLMGQRCYCYDDDKEDVRPGIERYLMGRVAGEACKAWAGYTWGTAEPYAHGLEGVHTFAGPGFKNSFISHGTVRTRIDVTGHDSTCEKGLKMDENLCNLAMGLALDECDMNGLDKKQGGKAVSDCFLWTIEPLTRWTSDYDEIGYKIPP